MLTLGMVEEFCLQYIERLESHVGGIRLAGLWDESFVDAPRRLLEMKVKGSPGNIQVCDPDATRLGPAYFKRFADESGVALVMGLDANLVRNGPVETIRSRARDFIDQAGRDGKFILFINDIAYDTLPEHVHAVVSVGHEYLYA